jgi:hypothetical protein
LVSEFQIFGFEFPVSIAAAGFDPAGKFRAGWQMGMT